VSILRTHAINAPITKPENVWAEEMEKAIIEFSREVDDILRNNQPCNIETTTVSKTAGNKNVILVDATSGNLTITLPPAKIMEGAAYTVKKIDVSANTVTIDGDGSETIDGATTKVLSTQWDVETVTSNGTAWYLI